MRITLNGFRCHLDRTFEFDDNKIHLLKGDSGIGKSTILWAIFWGLYGNLQHLSNAQHPTKKTSVLLEFDHVKITRSKRPDTLLVETITTDSNNSDIPFILTDQPAQDWIYSNFGKKENWIASSYLSQGDRHSLLVSGQQDRLDLIQNYSFQLEDPETYFDRLDTINQDIQSKFDSHQHIYITLSEQLNQQQIHLDRPILSVLQLQEYIINHTKNIQHLQILNNESITQKERQKNYDTWLNIKSSLETQWLNFTIPEINIPDIETQIQIYESEMKYLPIQTYKTNLLQSIEHMNLQLDILKLKLLEYNGIEPISQDMYQQLLTQRQQYNKHIQICKQLNIQYNVDDIQRYIDTMKHILEYQRWFPIKKAKLDLQSQIDKIPEKKMNPLDLETMKSTYLEWQQSIQVKHCPHCQKGIFIQNNELHCYHQPIATREQITQLEKNIQKWNQEWLLQQQRLLLSSKLSAYDTIIDIPITIPELDSIKIKEYTDIIKLLSSMTIIENVFDNLEIRKEKDQSIKNLEILKNGLEKQKEQLLHIPEIPTILKTEQEYKLLIQQNRNRIDIYNQSLKQKEEIFHKINQYQQLITSIQLDSTIDTKYEELKKQVDNEKEYLHYLEIANSYLDKKSKLDTDKIHVDTIHKELMCIQKLRQISKEVESEMLNDLVETLNTSMNEFAGILFDSPITLTLSTFKTLKSTKHTKPQINLQITYKNMECDWKQLSGGEIDRISLCILLAFSKLSPSPIILLDECLVSLDGNLKSIAIELLRQQTDKTVLVVLHDAVEGEFDNTLYVT